MYFFPLLTRPQGSGCQKMRQHPLNSSLEDWCAKIEPKLKVFEKIVKIENILISFSFSGILEYATLLAFKKYGNFEQSKMAKMQLKKVGSVDTSKVLEVRSGNPESNQTPGNFKDFSKIIDKWAFIGCSIYINIFVIIYMIVAFSR